MRYSRPVGHADEGKSVAGVDVIAEGTCIVILEGCRDLDDEGTGGGNELDGETVETSGPICGPIVGNVCFWPLRLLLFLYVLCFKFVHDRKNGRERSEDYSGKRKQKNWSGCGNSARKDMPGICSCDTKRYWKNRH